MSDTDKLERALLRMRVAKLERQSSSLPPGFQGYGFGMSGDYVPENPQTTTKELFERMFNKRKLSRYADPSRYLSDYSFIEGMIAYGEKATFIYADVPDSQARKISKKFFRNLKGRDAFPSNVPYFHDNILVVGTNDEKITVYANHMLSMSEHGSEAIRIFACLQALDPMIEKLEKALPCVETAIKLSEENDKK